MANLDCLDCIEKLNPEDPRQPFNVGFCKYLPPLCDSCDSGRNEPAERSKPESEWSKRQWDTVHQIQSEVRGWRKQHAETLVAIDNLHKSIAIKKKIKYNKYD